jgi:hypothetical protein
MAKFAATTSNIYPITAYLMKNATLPLVKCHWCLNVIDKKWLETCRIHGIDWNFCPIGDFFKPCPSRAKAGFKKSPSG